MTFFSSDRDDLVFLLRAGAGHLELAGVAGSDSHVFGGGLVRLHVTHSANSSSASIATGVRSPS
jgi:hypothetical protein